MGMKSSCRSAGSSWRVWFAAPLGLALVAAVVHCGSSDGGDIPGAEDGGNESGTSGDSSSTDGSTSTSPDGSADSGTRSDAGGEAGPIPEGGAPADPGKVACGATSCDVGTAFCCALPDGGGSCQTSGGACAALGGAKQECNEAADCPAVDAGPQVCCYEVDLGRLTTSCHLNCNGGGGNRYQACRSTTECLSGSCAVRSCNGDAGTATVESCKPIPGVCP